MNDVRTHSSAGSAVPGACGGTSSLAQLREWMGRSLSTTLPVVMVGASVLAQPGLAVAAWASELSFSAVLPVIVHLLLLALGVITIMFRLHSMFFFLPYFVALSGDHFVSLNVDDPLFSVVFIITPLTLALPILIYVGWWPVIACVAYSGVLAIGVNSTHPTWDVDVSWGVLMVNLTLVASAIVFIRALRSFGAEVDEQERVATEEQEHAARAAAATGASVEFTRVMHDTVVNTFDALGRKSIVEHDVEMVRARCRRDIERLQSLRRRHHRSFDAAAAFTFDTVGLLPLRRSGMSNAELSKLGRQVPPLIAHALHACGTEIILNASKHSDADEVHLDVRRDGNELVARFSDDGRGFSGHVVPGRGLDASVLGRAKRHGIRADLETAPGEGTTITLRYMLKPATSSVAPEEKNSEQSVRTVVRRTGWVWLRLMVIEGALTETIGNQGALTLGHLVVATVSAWGLVSWRYSRRREFLPTWLRVITVVAIPAINTLALAAIDFGEQRTYLYQAGCVAGLLVLLLIAGTGRSWFIVGTAAYLVSCISAGIYAASEDIELMTRVLLIQFLLLPIVAAWVILHALLNANGRRLARAWTVSKQSMLEIAAHEAADEVLARWNETGLDESLRLLEDIADGVVSIDDPEVRRRCREEERILREISSLGTEAAPMSWWFAQAIIESRARSVQLQIQVGGIVLRRQQEADALGKILLDCLALCDQDATLIATLIHHRGAPRLMLFGDLRAVPDHLQRDHADVLEISHEEFYGQHLVEATWRTEVSRDSDASGHTGLARGGPLLKVVSPSS